MLLLRKWLSRERLLRIKYSKLGLNARLLSPHMYQNFPKVCIAINAIRAVF